MARVRQRRSVLSRTPSRRAKPRRRRIVVRANGHARSTPRTRRVRGAGSARNGRSKLALTHGQTSTSQAARQQTSAEYLAALKEFEAAVRQFQKRNYERASLLFTKLTASRAHDVADRARIHLRLCEQKQNSEGAAPKNPEEFYLQGVAALNAGNLDGALDFLAKAHKLRPNLEHIQYALAAAHARQGNTDAAIERLKSAIELRPENRSQARHDEDFQSLAGDLRFIRLVSPSAG